MRAHMGVGPGALVYIVMGLGKPGQCADVLNGKKYQAYCMFGANTFFEFTCLLLYQARTEYMDQRRALLKDERLIPKK